MHLFYSPHIQTPEHTLPPDESLHCTRVLRLKKSDTVYLTDGKGSMCTGKVLDPDPAGCRILITHIKENYGARPYHLHLAVAPGAEFAGIGLALVQHRCIGEGKAGQHHKHRRKEDGSHDRS